MQRSKTKKHVLAIELTNTLKIQYKTEDNTKEECGLVTSTADLMIKCT